MVGPNGEQGHETIFMDLKQSGANLTGEAGPSAEEHWAIEKGKVDGDKVTFQVSAHGGQGPLLVFALALADGHLKGSATADFGGQKLTATIDVERQK